MKTNWLMKKEDDDKWTDPYSILKVYFRSCFLRLPEGIKIFLVFYNSLFWPKTSLKGLVGQDCINEAETKNIQGQVLEREDGIEKLIEKWKFEGLLNCYNEDSLHYLV